MDITQTPTKGNLMRAQNSLKMAAQGYDLLDRKRKLLFREMNGLMEKQTTLRLKMDETFAIAYSALREANIMLGIDRVDQLASGIPEEQGIDVKFYSVMGVEIPIVGMKASDRIVPNMSLYQTSLSFDEARYQFNKVKSLLIDLAEAENGIRRLSVNISKTQKRANALKNIMIPRYTALIAAISSSLEEKEREEFARLKVTKRLVKKD